MSYNSSDAIVERCAAPLLFLVFNTMKQQARKSKGTRKKAREESQGRAKANKEAYTAAKDAAAVLLSAGRVLLPGRAAIDRDQPIQTPGLRNRVELPPVDEETDTSEDNKRVQIHHFQNRLAAVPTITIEELQLLIQDASRSYAAIELYRNIIQAGLTQCLNIFYLDKGFLLSDLQIDASNTAIFSIKDIIIAERTGSGKSLVFYSYAILIGFIVFQVILLNRLGEEQMSDIQAAIRSLSQDQDIIKVCNITVENKKVDRDMLGNIRASQYQYIFLSPEQLASNNIRDIIRFYKNRIGMVGIDKLYLVYKQGDEFRPKYAELKSARKLLRLDTVLIRASATLSDETLQKVKALASFRLEAEKLFYLTVIRSSIDRLDTIYILKNIPSKVLRESQLMLYWLLKHAVDASSYAIPQNIDKALCFIDSYSSVNKSVQRFRQQLVNMTKDVVDTTKKYTINSANGSYNVCNIVSFYTSYIANADQDKRYAEFKKLSTASVIYILFGTPAVAIGTNFPNVKYVIQLRNAITKDIDDIIQRLGRAGRSLLAGEQAYAVLYLLQYLDNRERDVPANSNY